MGRTSVVDESMAKKAASIIIRAPALTVREAMMAAGFSEKDAKTKSLLNIYGTQSCHFIRMQLRRRESG